MPHARGVGAHRERRVDRSSAILAIVTLPVEEADAAAEIDLPTGLPRFFARGRALEEDRSRPRDGAGVKVVVLHESLGGEPVARGVCVERGAPDADASHRLP